MSCSILVIGAGPAASLTALGLHRAGHRVLLVGTLRKQTAIEGLSQRMAEALRMANCKMALDVLGERCERGSRWNNHYHEANGEYVVERRQFDKALLADLTTAGCAVWQAQVRSTAQTQEHRWRIDVLEQEGQASTISAEFLVEARGHAAPRAAPDQVSGPVSVALCRNYAVSRNARPITLAESFEDGWAWCAFRQDGRAMVQITLAAERLNQLRVSQPDLGEIHRHLMQRLITIPEALGKRAAPSSAVSLRGYQQILRGGITEVGYARVGDAAYSNDPLSGHGMYEAAAGALAVVPAINTMLRDAAGETLARHYLEQRASAIFAERIAKGAEFYAMERQWADRTYWSERSRWADNWLQLNRPRMTAPRFIRQPVVESGFIVEREILLTPDHPRGVRFIDGVELAALNQVLSEHDRKPKVEEFAAKLRLNTDSVMSAWRWLHRVAPTRWAHPG